MFNKVKYIRNLIWKKFVMYIRIAHRLIITGMPGFPFSGQNDPWYISADIVCSVKSGSSIQMDTNSASVTTLDTAS